jgi:puromycin-sensitive aminopeptidase
VSEAEHRLPRTVVPSRYVLTLEPDLDAATFVGSQVIHVEVTEPVDAIVLNATELEIDAATLVPATGDPIPVTGIDYDEKAERATLQLASPAVPGAYTLHSEFRGVLNDKLHGFYRSVYKDDEGNEHTIATTQFEATDARRAFPCWDEPDLKATFRVTLVVPEGMMAISNTAIVASEPTGDGRTRVEFAESMKMSTYLVAFIVGDLEATDWVDVDGTPLRIVTPPGRMHLAGFALEMGAFALRYFASYYDIPYPGDKVEMIAIPDFAWGAMENLGAITYRETALLVDPSVSTQAELTRVADVIAHELAHMWFGDLVTMKWWNGIWLNEAFATFMEMKCVDAFRPDWKRWLSFAADRAYAMDIDALDSTRPIEFPVASPEEANEMFDTLTYSKGAAVLRMLEQFLGEEPFRQGIARYLQTHAYGNTETADLWNALEAVSGEPVGNIMDTWIYQGGHPKVTLTPEGEELRVDQRHFRYTGESEAAWKVPLRYGHAGGTEKVVVDPSTHLVSLENLILNEGGHGFYRVQYPAEILRDLASRIEQLDPQERHAIVSDVWAGVLVGDVAAAEYLEMIQHLRHEEEPGVWSAALGGLAELDRIVTSDDRPALQAYVRDVMQPTVDRLGWSPGGGESGLTRQLRGMALRAMGGLGKDPETLAEARVVLDQFLDEPSGLDGDVATSAIAVVAGNGTMEDFDRFIAEYEAAKTPQDVIRYLGAAVAVPEPKAAEQSFHMVLDGHIRSQDAIWVLARMLGHRETGPLTWELMKANWDEMIAKLPPSNARRIIQLLPNRSEPEIAADIEAWLADHPIPSGTTEQQQQLERLRVRVGLRRREASRIGEALR